MRIKKTPLSVTFKEVKPNKFANQLQVLIRRTKGATKTQLKSISKQIRDLKSRLTGSPGAITLALSTDLERSISKATIPGAVLGVTIRSIWEGVGNVLSNPEFAFYSKIKGNKLGVEQRWIVSNLLKINLKIKTKQKTLQITRKKLKQRLQTKQRTELKIKQKQTNRQLQGLVQLQKIAQKLRRKLKSAGRGVGVSFGVTPPPPTPPKIPIILLPKTLKGFKRKTLRKKQPVFFVKVKKRGKIINLKPRPLTLRDARDFLAYEMDNTLIRSAWFEPIGRSKNVLLLPKKMRGYFNKIKKKLRPFKIRVGKKKLIRNGYIEKKKFIGDTRGEIRQLQTSRKRKSKRKLKRRNVRKGNQNRNSKRRVKRRIRKPIRKKIIRRRNPIRRKVKRKIVRRRHIRKRKIKRVIRRGNQRRNSKRRRIVRRVVKRKVIKRNVRRVRRKHIKRKIIRRRRIRRRRKVRKGNQNRNSKRRTVKLRRRKVVKRIKRRIRKPVRRKIKRKNIKRRKRK